MRVLIVEDDPIIVEGLKVALTQEKYETAAFGCMKDALDAVGGTKEVRFDVCLLDINLPDGDGYQICKAIREKSQVPIIFLTAKDQQEDVISGFKVGADDYITKPYSLPELSLRINVHIKRSMKSEGFLVEYPPLRINIKTREVTLKEKPLHLTNREFDILCLLAETPNVIVPFTRIYSHVWGDDSPCDNHLVMVNISYLRKKMEKIAPEITFVKTEWGIGYSFAYPPVKNSMNTQF